MSAIPGTEGLSPTDIQNEIARGARFVAYQWCISLLVVTLKRGTRIYYLKPGETGFLPGFLWSAFTLVAGWWGIPWGPIYTIGSLWTNARGGIDVTAAVAADLAARHGAEAPPPLPGAPAAGPRWAAGPLAALGVFAAAIAATISGTQYYAAQHRACALVNGLDTAYSATIDGVTHTLRPHSTTALELPEGPHAVVAVLPGGVGETRFVFTAGDHATVVNPDTAALVTEETSYYGSADANDKSPPPVIHCGREAYRFRNPDFFLQEFPSSVSMSEHETRTSRTRVAVYPDIALDQVAGIVLRSAGRKQCVEYLKALGAHLPSNQKVLEVAFRLLEPPEAKSFFSQHLATRPVLVEWHRAYQSYMQYRLPEIDLLSEYRRLADAETDDGTFAYLYGRLLDNPAEDVAWFERAISAKHPCAYAHGALAYAASSRGDLAGAIAALDRARAAGLDTATQREQRINCLLAAGQLEAALKEFRSMPAGASVDFGRTIDEMHLNFLAGGKPAAKRVVDVALSRLPESARTESGAAIRKALEAQIAYYGGDIAPYAASMSAEGNDSDRMIGALCRDDRAAAEKALAALPVQPSGAWLMLYLSAQLAHDARAEVYWDNALAAFAREPNGHRRLAAHFAGTTPLAPAELVDFPMDFGEKRLFLAALGLREPALRTAAFARARQCNFSRQFPHHLVAAALATAKP